MLYISEIMLSKIVPLLIERKSNTIIVRAIAAVSSPDSKTSNSTPTNLKSWKEIPGPSSLPVIGSALHFLPVIGSLGPVEDFNALSTVLYKHFGPIVRLEGAFGSPCKIFVFDVDMVEQVLRGENNMPERPTFESLEYYRRHEKQSTGLLTEQGECWKTFRSAVNPVMLQPKIIKLYKDEIDKVALDMIERMKSIRNDKNIITEDFEMEINKWSLESVGVVALGGRIGCLDQKLSEDSIAKRLIKNIRDTFFISNELDNKPSLWRYIKTTKFKDAMKIYGEQIEITKIFIMKAIEEYKKRDTNPENKGVLEKLLEVDINTAVVMASDMLVAGVDTTAHTMIGTICLLGANPDKQAKLREEVLSTPIGERRPYLKACIKEALRIYPIIGGNLRRVTKEYHLGKYLIPKKMNLILMNEFLSKQDIQFPRAEEFLPERWITSKDDPIHYGHAHPLVYSPFGFGVRMCIGRRIAELEIETFLSRLVENFEIEWFGPPPKRKSSPIYYIVGPYNFIFKDYKKV